MPETFADFWRMVWEQRSATIVMLTKLEERARIKCDQVKNCFVILVYFSSQGVTLYQNVLNLTLNILLVLNRVFSLKNCIFYNFTIVVYLGWDSSWLKLFYLSHWLTAFVWCLGEVKTSGNFSGIHSSCNIQRRRSFWKRNNFWKFISIKSYLLSLKDISVNF